MAFKRRGSVGRFKRRKSHRRSHGRGYSRGNRAAPLRGGFRM